MAKLSILELLIYFVVWIIANFYCLYKLFVAQNEIYRNTYDLLYSLEDMRPGWRFISRLQDVSDIEWSTWKYFISTAWLYLLIQFFISEIIRNTKMSLLKYWYIASSMLFIVLHMGYKQLIIISFQPVMFCTIILFGGRKICIWIASIAMLVTYNSMKYKYFFWNYLDRDDLHDEEVYLVLFTVAWIKLRCVSFCIDYCDKNKEKTLNNLSTLQIVVNIFSYVLYTPLLYIGPIILYEDFEKSFSNCTEKLTVRLRRFICNIFIFSCYTFILDCAFHYIYFIAMQNDTKAIQTLPTLALCGGGLWMGLEFHMKYVISYGTTTAFARLDNMDTPPTPRCIARVHIYSQMWRYFDVGLYKFLVKYIYKPCLDIISKLIITPKIVSKLMASLVTFVFIFMWHGTIWNIFVWSVLNYLGITLEEIGKLLSDTYAYKLFKEHVLITERMELRFVALICTPLLALSAISNFYLFAGTKVGNIYFECFTNPSLFNSILVSTSLYCCCHVSMALKNVPSRTDVQRKDLKTL